MLRPALFLSAALLLSACSLGQAPASLRGEVFYHTHDDLPEDAVLSVRLLDLTRADEPPRELARQQEWVRGPIPRRFHLLYDPADIQPGHSYAVQARIQYGEHLLFVNTVHHGVLLDGSDPQPIRVRVAALE